MRVAFRLDATAALGLGHLKRCLALAVALRERGAQLCFVGHADTPALTQVLAAEGIAWLELPHSSGDADADATLAALPWRADAVVVDHYGLDARWHRAVRAAGVAAVVVIDDLADRPLDADLLVDHNPSPDHAAKYRKVLQPGVPICGGPAYALLDAAYRRALPQALRAGHGGHGGHGEPRCIGIFMGGTDPGQHSAWALQVLRGAVAWRGTVRVASTSANGHLPALRAACAAHGAELLLDLPHLADFHAGCDIQVGAGGGALWERCCLGVPTVALVCADNQRLSIPLAAQAGAVVGLDASGQTPAQAAALAEALRALIADAPRRQALRAHAMALVDGQGATRVAERLLALVQPLVQPQRRAALPTDMAIELRAASLADAELLLRWRNDPHTRANSHSVVAIGLDRHRQWLQDALDNPLRTLWIACRDGQPVGTVRADLQPSARETTLSWTVAPEQRGSGVGRLMVQQAAARIAGPLHAEVKVGNEASARIACAAGLSLHSQVGETLHFRRD